MSDLVDLKGKTALVTGAAKRMGAAVSLALAKAGVNVVIHYRNSREAAESVAKEARAGGVQAWPIAADLAAPHEAEALFDRVLRTAGPIAFLINNASIFPEQRFLEFTAEELHASINVNALAPLLLARCFAAQGREGAIVNFLDSRIADYDRQHVPYHLSKRMLFSLTRMMALEFAPRIRVNAVAPGLVLPPEGKDISYLEALKDTDPLRSYGSTADVCEAVLFLLRSGFVTGQVIFVDGGRHLQGSVYG